MPITWKTWDRALTGAPSRRQETIDDEDDETTQFAKNFARGFIQRQQQGLGEDDD